ncbi:unnamed protein product [Acanthoscelides obtectus]|uniref:Uncharacterized protein n=1 Tax=Acanthoscelides obtectus TaxID=200917 RepID=A0A9P0MB84_ACAOB|nr:unnamed protein product [Acanthoscelides obtectus]CAK1651837.1 hypothetical protein AOBTE_LOCUS17491 [Acanthoscelides obtectus]
MIGRLTPVQIDQPSLPESSSLLQTVDLLHLLSHVFHVPNTPSWTGFNCRILEDNSLKQKVSYLTPINLSPTNVSVVAYTMEQAQSVGKECGQAYVQVSYDLAIAKIALKIQATEGLKFSNLFIHLGSFYLMMAFFKAVGTFIDECGLSHMMIESKIIASGSVNGIIEGKHFNRCKRLHPLMALGLQILHFDQFLKTERVEHNFVKGQIYEDLLEYQDKKISQSSTLRDLLPNEILSQLLTSYQQYIAETRQGNHGKTAQFYMIYIQLIRYYVNLSRSIRMGDFEMFKAVISKMANLVFIVNQPNYARYCVKYVYVDNLNNVADTHPGLEDDFNKGFFGVKRTDKPFSRVPIDLTLEQTINADAAKRLSGISHFTNSIAARQRWSKSHSIRAALISHVLDICGLRYLEDVTADLQPNRMKIYGKQLADFVEVLEKNCNPFDPSLDSENLYNIATSKPVSPEVADYLISIEENGEGLRNQFINECAEDESRFDKPIKKNRVLNFTEAPKKKKLALGNKVVELRMQRDLFGRMLGISLTHKVDIEKVLSFPLTPMPTSMCHPDGSICKTDKAQLTKLIEKKLETAIDQQPSSFDISIVDGFFMLHLMKEIPQTFDGIAKKFLSAISQMKSVRIDVIFDQYFSPSIKDFERSRREESTIPVFIGPNQIRPHNFGAELKNMEFKIALVNFFIDHWDSEDMVPFIGNKIIYVSFNKCYSYKVLNNKVVRSIEESLSCEEHEEADSRIIYHICQIDFDADVVIRCSDSDILIILMGNMDHLNAFLKIWINIGVGNHQRYVNVNELYRILGDSLSKALPCFHAITGCDYTPAFIRKGKVRPFKILEQSKEYQSAFGNITTDNEDLLDSTFVILEKFVCQMYGVKNSSDVNSVRFHLFSNTFQSKKSDENFEKKFRNFDSSSLPPCKAELQQHLLRVRYVTKLWRNAHLKHPTSLSPVASGWTIKDNKYDFVWFLGEQLPSSIADIIIQNERVLRNDDNDQDDDFNTSSNESDDDDDCQDASFVCNTIME